MPPTRDGLARLLSLLEQHVGLRLQGSAAQALGAFDALADELQLSETELLERLIGDSALLEKLATQLTIPETHFFRIGPQVTALRELVLPDLERRWAGKRRLRFWSAGCSTGEEAYTLAILAAQGLSARTEVGILGTDLHPQSLETARRGEYGAWSFRDTPDYVRDRCFAEIPREQSPAQPREQSPIQLREQSSTQARDQSSTQARDQSSTQARDQSAKWQIKASLRQIVRFETLNLLSADWSPLERFDLILCRNVMIYFSNATAQHLIERLAAQLQPGGWLILGPSDPPPLHATLERSGFSVRYERGAMLYQKQMAGQLRVTAPSFATLELPPLEGLLVESDDPIRAAPIAPRQDGAAAQTPDFERQLQLGMDALEAADLPAALKALRGAVYLEPQSALAQFLLAKTLLDSAQPDRARVALRQAQRLLHSGDDSNSGDLHISDFNSSASSTDLHRTDLHRTDLHRTDLHRTDLHRAVTALSVTLGEA